MTLTVSSAPGAGGALFSTMMGEIGRKSTGWHGLVVMLSRLPVGEKRTTLSSQVQASVDSALAAPHGTLVLPNRDVLTLIRDASGESLPGAADVAARILASANLDPVPLIRRFNLATELPQFIAAVSGVDIGKGQRPQSGAAVAAAPERTTAKRRFPWEIEDFPIAPKDVAKIEKTFFKANIVNFIRNQTAYRLVTDNELEEYLDEIFISIDYLVKFLANKDIANDRWLFQHFTRTLDARILSALGASHEGERKEVAYSINLNVATLFSEDFLIYDRALPPRVRRGQIIELQAFDVIENIGEMPFLLAFFKARGYRVCIDAVSAELFGLMDWASLDVSMVKLHWSAAFPDGGKPMIDDVAALSKGGRIETVLCRCEDEAALDWGAKAGVTVFQGWYLDGLKKGRSSDQPKPRYRLRDRSMVY